MGYVNSLIAAGRKLLGTTEHPPGSNHNFITEWYNANVDRIGDGAWCDMSVTYEAWHSDNQAAIGGGFAYVPAHAEWFRAHGRWHYGISGIKSGDVVFFEWSGRRTTNADHVGVVERVLSDGTIYTLEGNIADAFRREHRDGTYVAGYGRPFYDTEEDDLKLTDVVNHRGWTVGKCLQDAGQGAEKIDVLTTKVDALAAAVAQLADKLKDAA